MDDLVKRSDILPWLKEADGVIIFNALAVSKAIGQIPVAEPSERMAQYLPSQFADNKPAVWQCSNCGFETCFPRSYCPKCGRKMEMED